MRLNAACDLVQYYEMVGCNVTPGNICWNPGVIKNFAEQWKALLVNRKAGDKPKVPKISKTLTVIKWTEPFTDFLHRIIRVRMIPLAYVAHSDVLAVPNIPPPLDTNRPHSVEHCSVEQEMIERCVAWSFVLLQ